MRTAKDMKALHFTKPLLLKLESAHSEYQHTELFTALSHLMSDLALHGTDLHGDHLTSSQLLCRRALEGTLSIDAHCCTLHERGDGRVVTRRPLWVCMWLSIDIAFDPTEVGQRFC